MTSTLLHDELSLVELDAQTAEALPARETMSRWGKKKRHGGGNNIAIGGTNVAIVLIFQDASATAG